MHPAIHPLGHRPFAGLVALTGVATLVFGLLYPTHFLIADETVYFGQAQTWATGQITQCLPSLPCPAGACMPQLPGDYPAGTGLLGALVIALAGTKAVFWGSFLCWLAGTWAIGLLLHHNGRSFAWAFFPWLYLPAVVLSRTVMSEMPSFALAAFFLYGYLGRQHGPVQMLATGFIAGLGVLFRETNVLWALPFLVGALIRRRPDALGLWTGFALGLMPRLVSGALLFGDPLHIRNPGLGFSLQALPRNLAFYLFALVVLLPGSLWLLRKSKWAFRSEVWGTLALFLCVFGAYEYDAFAKSGYKALVLQGRFLVPFLPALALAAAYGQTRVHQLVTGKTVVLGVLTALLFSMVHLVAWSLGLTQQYFTGVLYRLPNARQISFSPDETRKYINGLAGQMDWYAGEGLSRPQIGCDTVWYAHLFSRDESRDREKKALDAYAQLQQFWNAPLPDPFLNATAADGTRLRIWKLILPPDTSYTVNIHAPRYE